MILPFKKTWLLIMVMIIFVTSFGIDVWWLGTSILDPCWHPCVMKFNVCWWSFVWCVFETVFDIYIYIYIYNLKAKDGTTFFVTFSPMFRRWCFWRFIGSRWLPFGFLLDPFGSSWIVLGTRLDPFWIPHGAFFVSKNIFDVVWYLFRSRTQPVKSSEK